MIFMQLTACENKYFWTSLRSTGNVHLVAIFRLKNVAEKMLIAHLAINRHRTSAVWLYVCLSEGYDQIGRVLSTSAV